MAIRTERFKELERRLLTLNNQLRKKEIEVASKAQAIKIMNKNVKKGDIIELPVLVALGEHTEFKVIGITPTGMLHVESTISASDVHTVTFDIEVHEPLFDIVMEMMQIYADLEEERTKMKEGYVDLKDI